MPGRKGDEIMVYPGMDWGYLPAFDAFTPLRCGKLKMLLVRLFGKHVNHGLVQTHEGLRWIHFYEFRGCIYVDDGGKIQWPVVTDTQSAAETQ